MLTLKDVVIEQGGFYLTASFTVPAGERLALIGPSGAGKSTLLSCLAGFLPPQSGQLLWHDRDITDLPPGRRPVAMLFQDNNHFPHLTVAQNVGLGLRPTLKLSRAEWDLVQRALERVNLTGLGDRKPGTLSGGQQSRAALARVLVQQRPLVLLDEPFAALGPALKSEMLDLVRELVQETKASLIMVTHDPADAKAIATSVSVVAENQVTAPRPTQQVFDHPPAVLRAYLG